MSNSLQPGSVFARRYRIVRLIGAGGMGSVYEAEDELSGDVLALKVISSAAQADDLRQELLIGRKLTHKNVVRIYDIGLEDSTLFISMELVNGADLAVLLQEKGRFNANDFLQLFE